MVDEVEMRSIDVVCRFELVSTAFARHWKSGALFAFVVEEGEFLAGAEAFLEAVVGLLACEWSGWCEWWGVFEVFHCNVLRTSG